MLTLKQLYGEPSKFYPPTLKFDSQVIDLISFQFGQSGDARQISINNLKSFALKFAVVEEVHLALPTKELIFRKIVLTQRVGTGRF